jgi:hypothetical protein
MIKSFFSGGLFSNWEWFEILQTPKVILALSIIAIGILFRIHVPEARPCPPGPKPRWFIGNAIPGDRQWLQFDEWSKVYGKFQNLIITGFEANTDCFVTKETLYALLLWVTL